MPIVRLGQHVPDPSKGGLFKDLPPTQESDALMAFNTEQERPSWQEVPTHDRRALPRGIAGVAGLALILLIGAGAFFVLQNGNPPGAEERPAAEPASAAVDPAASAAMTPEAPPTTEPPPVQTAAGAAAPPTPAVRPRQTSTAARRPAVSRTPAAAESAAIPVPAVTGVGFLSVNAKPWADVWVDGRSVGTTPLANLRLSVGAHEVIWRHPNLGERRRTIHVGADAPARASVDFRN